MEIIFTLAAVLLAAILRASWIKKHESFLGMKKTEPKLGQDEE